MSQIHGQATIRMNGTVLESEDTASLIVGGLKNNGRMVGRKFVHNQTMVAARVKCKVAVGAGTSLRDLQEISGAEIIFESDTGRTWIIRDAAQSAELELSGGAEGGTVELEFTGNPAEEMAA
jgi:hypothetical protein